jgi:transposase
VSHRGFTHLGLDVSKDQIVVAVLDPDKDRARVHTITHDEASVRKLVDRFEDRSKIWVCYEAGPTGYELYRLLSRLGVRCDVVAPSLVPKKRDRIKTDKRDARLLAGQHRAGELTAVAVPSPQQEAVRDLVRVRGDMVEDLTQARNRLSGFLLRHSIVWRGGSNWTLKHQRWLAGLTFDDHALRATFSHYRATVSLRDSSLEAIESELEPYCSRDPFGVQVRRLAAYRGVTTIGGLCISAEIFDWRRFPAARSLMCFTGLVPSEKSTGQSEYRGSITHAGNRHVRAQLVEAAWSYRHRPHVGAGLAARQEGLAPEILARSWKAQVRLYKRYQQLNARKNVRSVVAAAIARELAGFLWAEMTADHAA